MKTKREMLKDLIGRKIAPNYGVIQAYSGPEHGHMIILNVGDDMFEAEIGYSDGRKEIKYYPIDRIVSIEKM